MKIYLASDHAGFDLKEKIKTDLQKKGYDIEDCGAFAFDKDDDYPDFISLASEKVAEDQGSIGLIFGKSGTGEAIVSNKIKGIRAVVGFNNENVKLSREHNNANVLSLGSQFIDFDLAKDFVNLFLQTPFSSEERHVKRINKIKEIENKS